MASGGLIGFQSAALRITSFPATFSIEEFQHSTFAVTTMLSSRAVQFDWTSLKQG
jgi:hypothetical protein